MEVEMNSGTTASSVESTPASSTPAPEPVTQAQTTPEPASTTPPPAHEPSLRERFAQKAAEVAAKEAKGEIRDPKTGKFVPKTAATAAQTDPAPATPTAPPTLPTGEIDPVKPAETPGFVPAKTVRVMDQDREIPAILQPLMKDAASQKEIVELCERAFGHEALKPKYEENKRQLDKVSNQNAQVFGQIQDAVQTYKRGDFSGWLKKMGVPEERVWQWAAEKLEYEKLPPEQKAIWDQRQHAEERAVLAETGQQQLQQQQGQLLTQQVQGSLDLVLARPEVKAVADAFDARVGKPGAFRAEACQRGDYAWKVRKQLVPPDQLVTEMMSLYGPGTPPAAPAPAAAALAAPTPQTPPATHGAKVPTLPNISGRSVSGVAPAKPRSIADLKNIRNKMMTENKTSTS